MKNLSVYLMGIIYIYLGILHFTNTDFYFSYMPEFLPYHWELIIASGIAEIILGVGVFFNKYRNYSLWGIILMLIIFLTVHFNMLIPENSIGNATSLLILRVFVQFGIIYWAWKNIK
tara:strand:- start:48 stop:398 length:351 start_codon:yes stop_codon:yes gene_type:complete